MFVVMKIRDGIGGQDPSTPVTGTVSVWGFNYQPAGQVTTHSSYYFYLNCSRVTKNSSCITTETVYNTKNLQLKEILN